jgi:biopolymer transport protein TolQ
MVSIHMIEAISWVPVLADTATPNIINYFGQSNVAGKVIVMALIFFSLIAWTIMIGKYFDLRRMGELNRAFEDRLMSGPSVLDQQVPQAPGIPYNRLYHEAVVAYRRVEDSGSVDPETLNRLRISHMENALQRCVTRGSALYESRMVFLASIVTGAPFLGLLGTVWGVMDAFGAVALRATATLQMLAPGVSGALLTTVAGLLVAIPSVFGYNILLTRTREMIAELENFASTLADQIEMESKREWSD